MNSDQARMARALVQLGVREIAAKAGVTPNTVSRIENGGDSKKSTMDAIQTVYEGMGVHFIAAGQASDGPSVVRK